MKIHTKALLASALIVPGSGQFLLKRYKSAVFFITTSIAAVAFVLVDVMSKALQITDKILAGEVEPNLFVIRELIAQQQANSDSHWVTIVSVLFGIIWLVSIFDVYRQRK